MVNFCGEDRERAECDSCHILRKCHSVNLPQNYLSMEETSIVVKIVIAIIVLHLVVGFGFLMYKLSPRKGDQKERTDENEVKSQTSHS